MSFKPETSRRPAISRRIVLPALCATLMMAVSACGSESEDRPGGVTKEEAAALDAAARMLEERDLPPELLSTDTAVPAPQPS